MGTMIFSASCAKPADEPKAFPFMGGPDCTNPSRGFMPPNSMKVPVNARFRSAMTEAAFNAILDRLDSVYRPVIAGLGGQLVIDRRWTDDTVNAFAERNGNQYIIRMYGGMARHPRITADGFAIVACHEMGHHLGGAPKVLGQWLSNEGQSDYFATLKCFRTVFGSDNNAQILAQMSVDPVARQKCEANFKTAEDIDVCIRAAMAGQAAAYVTSTTALAPSFSSPDTTVVAVTQDTHPAPQCRLDTYVGGSVCPVSAKEALSEADPTAGTCSVEKGWKDGVRPLCWYKPSGSSPNPNPNPNPNPIPDPVPNPTPSGVTPAPLVRGQSQLTINNPYSTVQVTFDVSSVKGAGSVYIEVSQPNAVFQEPNGINPDPYALMNQWVSGTIGSVTIVPVQNLPTWGSYQIRVIALDGAGQNAVAAFSNAAVLNVFPYNRGPLATSLATGFAAIP